MEIDRHLFYDLPGSPGTYCLLAGTTAVKTAVIFVHGFNGNSYDTWSEFQSLVDDTGQSELRIWWRQCDMFFLQYKSVEEHLEASSATVAEFVNRVFPIPESDLFVQDLSTLEGNWADFREEPAAERLVSALPSARHYERLILVGHSEGAAIIRRAVINAIEKDSAQLPNSSSRIAADAGEPILEADLRLFAPALFGYKPSGLWGIVTNLPFMGQVLDAVLQASPSYQDLRYPSEFLNELREKTEMYASRSEVKALRARILWGRKEDIVKVGRYSEDRIDGHVDGMNHTTVCKPAATYLRPLEFVRND